MSGLIAEASIEEVKERADILAVASEFTELKRQGQEHVGLCPFPDHKEKTGSFSVTPDEGLYHCFGCQKGSDTLQLVMDLKGFEFVEAVEYLADISGVELQYEGGTDAERKAAKERAEVRKEALRAVALAAEHYRAGLLDPDDAMAKKAREYLTGERGLTPETLETYGVGYAHPRRGFYATARKVHGIEAAALDAAGLQDTREGKSGRDFFSRRITFPIRDVRGRAVAFGGRVLPDNETWTDGEGKEKTAKKYLNSRDSDVFTKRQLLYGLDVAMDAIRQTGRAIIVEGYTDVLALYQAGIKNVVATLGTATTTEHMEILSRHANTITLVFDSDTAGQKAVSKAKEAARKKLDLRVLLLGEGTDPAEWLEEHSAEEFQELLVKAPSVIEWEIRRAADAARGADMATRARELEGVKALVGELDDPVFRHDYARQVADAFGVGVDDVLLPTIPEEIPAHLPLPGTNGNGSASGGSLGGNKSGPFRLTDFGNAERLASRHGEDIRYVYAWSKFLVWDGTRWKMDDTGEVERRAKDTVRGIYGEASNVVDSERRKAIVKHATASESRKGVEAMAALLRSEPGIAVRVEDLDADPWLINARNGTIDLRTGDLRPHDRGDLITQIMPVDYDPDAKGPTFEKFLRTILPSPAMRSFVKRLFGQALYGKVAEHILPIFYGTGANGKSTLLLLVLDVLGDYGLMAADDLLIVKGNSHPTEQADLFGKRLVVNVETDQGKRLAEGRVKKLTGGEKVRARRMREDFWQFDPSHSLVVGTNHKPHVVGTDNGIWRRLRLVPFGVSIPESEQDKHLGEKLLAEAQAVLAWMMEGCIEWQREGLGEPHEVKVATEGYRAEMDVLAAFVDDCCVVHPAASAFATPLYEEYVAWCTTSGEKIETQTTFGAMLGERGFEKRRETSGEGRGRKKYFGIGILTPGNSPNGGNGGERVNGSAQTVHTGKTASPSGKDRIVSTASEQCDPKIDINSSKSSHEELMPEYGSHPSHYSRTEENESLRNDEKEDMGTAHEHEKEPISASLAGATENASSDCDSDGADLTPRERAERLRERKLAEGKTRESHKTRTA